jgi:hypothetical protein
MQTTDYQPDLLVVPELVGLGPFKTLKALVAQKREELEAQGQGTTLKRIGITVRSLRCLAEDPALTEDAKKKDPGGFRLCLPTREILGDVLGLVVDVIEPDKR